MKQVNKIFRKKSLKNVQKIIFPFSVSGQQLNQTQLLSNLRQKQQLYDDKDLSNNLKPITRSKSKTRTQQLHQRIYRQFQHQHEEPDNQIEHKVNGKFRKQLVNKSRSLTTVKKVRFVGIGQLAESARGKAEKKGRSLTKVDSHSIKDRSVTKCDSQWLKGRAVEMQKEREKVHKFDAEKIDRTYDHLGKLKKSTKNKTVFSTKFMSTKTLTKHIPSLEIDQQTFQQAKRQFHMKFKHIPVPNAIQEPCISPQSKQRKKTPSPKLPRKNLFKPSPHQKRQSPHGLRQNDKQKQIRVSADEPLFKVRHQNQDEDNLLIQEPSEESFFSEVNNNGGNDRGGVAGILGKMFAGEQKLEKIVSKGNDQEDDAEMMTERPFSQEQIVEQHNIASQDKVYFFSSKLSFGGASLFTIERINLKSRHNESFTIEVIIKAYEQTLVQKIVYEKSRKCETFKRLKPALEQEQQKERLKGELFSELILKKQTQKNRESIPESLHLNSEKPLLLRQSQWPSLNATSSQHPNLHNLSNLTLQPECHKGNRSSHSSEQFTTVSQQCYSSIISYIEHYCHLQLTYLGASLKQSTGPAPILFNQLMKKKHSQMQQTLLQSLNLAQVYYFMIKINTTYYISKSIVIGGTKLKHYLLYEFSNLIRHEKGCIIEEDEELGQDVSKVRRGELVQRIYFRVMALFNDKLNVPWTSDKQKVNSHNPNLQPSRSPFKKYTNTRSIPLINALQLCFGTIKNIGLTSPQDQDDISSERLYKITQNNNYRNDVRWQRLEYELSDTMRSERAANLFQWHGAFDCALFEKRGDSQSVTNKREMLKSSYFQSLQLRQRQNLRLNYCYHISSAFQLSLTLYPSLLRSHRHLIPLHPSTLPLYRLTSSFQQQQFTLLHMPQSPSTSLLLNTFLKKHYLLSIVSNLHQRHNPITNSTPFLSLIKNRRYFINVYIPFLLQPNPWNDSKRTILKENIWILIESRVSVKRYMVKMTFEEIFDEMKEYHRLYSDVRSYKRYIESIKRIKKEMYNIPIDVLKDRIKFFVSKLKLMKKNTYSQFYFIPIKHLVSEASYQASYHEQSSLAPKSSSKLAPSSSFIQTNKSLIISTLSQLQAVLNQQQKSSKSVITKIRLKNFPTYQIYYKTTRKLLPGYFLLMSIYYVPLFDLSEIKIYVTKIKKSFVVAVRKNIQKREYENVVMVLVEWLKDKFFAAIIRRESEKLSTKYREFYSKMIKQAESPFISRTRKNKDALLGLSHILNSSTRRPRHQRPYSINQTTFTQLTQQLLCKTFHSHKKNKYIIRLSYPSTASYIQQPNRKGIDQVINISILKQNCMTIYKFQTTARALLRKNVTHKFNVVQLEYQEKNKPYYILFQEIKILIQDSDQSTYGLLNTFRSYFMNKHYNALTTNNMISMFSINLLAGLGSNNLLSSSSDINSNSNNSGEPNLNMLSLTPTSNNIRNKHTYNFDTQKQLNIKELNSTMYQRYCLFVQQGKFFEVLKVRNRTKKISLSKQDNRRNSSSSAKIERSQQKIPVKRRSLKKQSIEAHLPSKEHQNRLKSSLKNPTAYNSSIRHSKTYSKNTVNFRDSPEPKHAQRTSLQPQPQNAIKVSSPSHHKIDFILQQPEPYHAASQTSNTSLPQHSSHNPNIQQKIVYMIDKQTQSITEIPSSIEDQGFVINVPFGLYNRKMFKRFFRNILWKECEERKKYGQSSQNSEDGSEISVEQSSRRDIVQEKPRNSTSLLGKDRNSIESNKAAYLESHCQIITSNFTISDC